MVAGLLGHKIGMTQIFDEFGNIIPVTLLKVGPCVITQIKTKKIDGYNSIQLGYWNVSSQSLTQPKLGHLQKSNLSPVKYLAEFKGNFEQTVQIGQTFRVDLFEAGQLVKVRGKSIGKGFSSLQKRHNFTIGPMSHGSKNHRAPGSIGMGTTPGRVLPGKKMSGQLGNKNVTISNLKIIQVNFEENLLVVKGSVPGKPGNIVSIMLSE